MTGFVLGILHAILMFLPIVPAAVAAHLVSKHPRGDRGWVMALVGIPVWACAMYLLLPTLNDIEAFACEHQYGRPCTEQELDEFTEPADI
ncbi:hypothetical protein [Sphingomonas ginsenosidimutans]|jgi:hypothetical protein|uniref:hypothetical protein n=1 Tax=Sphingomonas ginsenosidimutans TaxID=862134 RepID=UPI001D1F36C1|nr:hypothetical protein [Sphingomonas ginsenosidimutans]MBY0301266.1 hypothetical protein [Sphingomonas ginsenosidimutans]